MPENQTVPEGTTPQPEREALRPAVDDKTRAEQYFEKLYAHHMAKLNEEYGAPEEKGDGHGAKKTLAAVVAAVALAAGVAAILDFFGSSFKEPADGSADGSAEGSFLATWLILSAVALVLGFFMKSLSSTCSSCLIKVNAKLKPGEETDSIRGPTALDYLGYASQCAADAVAILTVPAVRCVCSLKLSSDISTRRNQVHTLVRATEDYRQWGKEAIGCAGTAASFNLTIFLCGALVSPTAC